MSSAPTPVDILVFDGFDELDAVGPFEVLAAAGLPTRLVTVEHRDEVRAAHGLRLRTDGTPGAPHALLLVPGGPWPAAGRPGLEAEIADGRIPRALADHHASGGLVASVCTGALLLAAAGLLDGRPAITHRSALEDLGARGAHVRADARVVDDGDVLTAGGVTAGLDLALHLVERLVGPDAAAAGAVRIEHERSGVVVGAAR